MTPLYIRQTPARNASPHEQADQPIPATGHSRHQELVELGEHSQADVHQIDRSRNRKGRPPGPTGPTGPDPAYTVNSVEVDQLPRQCHQYGRRRGKSGRLVWPLNRPLRGISDDGCLARHRGHARRDECPPHGSLDPLSAVETELESAFGHVCGRPHVSGRCRMVRATICAAIAAGGGLVNEETPLPVEPFVAAVNRAGAITGDADASIAPGAGQEPCGTFDFRLLR